MKRLAILLATFVSVPALAHDKGKGSDEDLKGALAAFDTAWNAGDTKTVIGLYDEDASIVTPIGETIRGKAEIEKRMPQMLTAAKGTSRKGALTAARWIDKETALVDADVTTSGIKGPDGKELPPKTAHMVALLTKKGDKWLILDSRPYFFATTAAMAAQKEPAKGK